MEDGGAHLALARRYIDTPAPGSISTAAIIAIATRSGAILIGIPLLLDYEPTFTGTATEDE